MRCEELEVVQQAFDAAAGAAGGDAWIDAIVRAAIQLAGGQVGVVPCDAAVVAGLAVFPVGHACFAAHLPFQTHALCSWMGKAIISDILPRFSPPQANVTGSVLEAHLHRLGLGGERLPQQGPLPQPLPEPRPACAQLFVCMVALARDAMKAGLLPAPRQRQQAAGKGGGQGQAGSLPASQVLATFKALAERMEATPHAELCTAASSQAEVLAQLRGWEELKGRDWVLVSPKGGSPAAGVAQALRHGLRLEEGRCIISAQQRQQVSWAGTAGGRWEVPVLTARLPGASKLAATAAGCAWRCSQLLMPALHRPHTCRCWLPSPPACSEWRRWGAPACGCCSASWRATPACCSSRVSRCPGMPPAPPTSCCTGELRGAGWVGEGCPFLGPRKRVCLWR